jgi:hypothetical protein
MAIPIPAEEHVLERLTATVGGKAQELILTDRAIYYEGRRSPAMMWLNAVLMPLATLIGLGLFYRYLSGGRLFVRHSLERIDAVTTRHRPLPSVALLGGVLAAMFGVNVGLTVYATGDVPRSVLTGYGVAIAISLAACLVLVRLQLSSLSVNSLNGNFTFDTYRSFEEVQRVQNLIWKARAELLSRSIPIAFVPPAATPAPPAPPPPAPPPPGPSGRKSKRR